VTGTTSDTRDMEGAAGDGGLPQAIGGEPVLAGADFIRFRELVLDRTGILFAERRLPALARGLARVAREARCSGLDELYSLLQRSKTDTELWDELVSHVTIGETYFFRNAAHMHALRKHVLPELISRRRRERRLRIWCAGCATGEEPYSVAILLRELLPVPSGAEGLAETSRWNILILATDINRDALAAAREAVYQPWSLRDCDDRIRRRYFSERDGSFGLRPEVREMVSFAYLNLAEDAYPSLASNTNAMDLVICRNVFIYLSEQTSRKVSERLHRCMAPDGWLIVGAAETGTSLFAPLASHNVEGAIIYQKQAEAAERPAQPRPALPRQALLIETPAPPRRPPRPRAAPAPSPPAEPDRSAEAARLAREGRYKEAIACFCAYVIDHPGSPTACCQLARLYANVGNLDTAEKWASRAIELDPLLTEAHYTLGLIRQERGALEGAAECFKRTLYLEPEFIVARFSLAGAYQALGRARDAARERRQVVRLAAGKSPDEVLPGSDGTTVGRLLTMLEATEAMGTP